MKQNTDNGLQLMDCACRNLRMTTRVVTQYYDKALYASGLKATQFSLLNSISSKVGGLSVSELADLSMMDQTTVTRNIEILRKKGYVNVRAEDADLRRKSITVSDAGESKLIAAVPLWEAAQLKIEQGIGLESYKEFLKILSVLKGIK